MNMKEWRWIEKKVVVGVHNGIIVRLGGADGILDERKLESALERPKNAQYYESINDVYELAGIYVDAVANAHAFCDGNKRTALAVAMLFLEANNHCILHEDDKLEIFNEQAAELTERIATHEDGNELTAADMAEFFRKNVFPV